MQEIFSNQHMVFYLMALIAMALGFQTYLQHRLKKELRELTHQSDKMVRSIRDYASSSMDKRDKLTTLRSNHELD